MAEGSTLFDRLRLLAFAGAAVLVLGACAATPSQPPQAAPARASAPAASAAALPALKPTPPPPGLDAVGRFAWQQVLSLGDAFAAGDADGFLVKVSRGFYRGYTTLDASLRALLEGSTARTAVVAVREVAGEDGRVSVRAEWTRTVTRKDGSVDGRHGETVFLFLKSDTNLRLLDYRGDAPFGIDGI
jgi:hypothetical protein